MLLSSGCTSAISQSVAVLEIGNFNLSGSLPDELGVFTSLSTLYLSDNPGKPDCLLQKLGMLLLYVSDSSICASLTGMQA